MMNRILIPVAAAVALGLPPGAHAQQAVADQEMIRSLAASKTAAGDAAIVAALNDAMTPGEGQKKLEFLVGTFDVKILTWLDPAKPPYESTGVAVHKWVLGNRYVQTMLSAFVMGEPFNAIGYAGYDNVAKKYVVTYMDSGSTGMEWYTGSIGADGKVAKLSGTITDAITRKPLKLEMRLSIGADGSHVTELWQGAPGAKMSRAMQVTYVRQKS